MNTLLTLALLATTSLAALAGNYELVPKNHSHKWLNGSEWAIDEHDGIRLKVLFQESRAGKLKFTVNVRNQGQNDVNIDPDSIYYVVTEFGEITVRTQSPTMNRSPRTRVSGPSVKSLKEKFMAENDTVFVEKADKLLKNAKLLVGLGFVFDSDNLAINRGHEKIDYYKENLLLKNTIEPKQELEKLLIIDEIEEANELNLVIWLNNKPFQVKFKKHA